MKKSLVGWISVGCIVAVLILAGIFQDYIGARVLNLKGGRASVSQGEVFSLQFPKTTAAFVKIELCQEGKTPEKCALIASKVPAKTQNITIPKNAVLGKATIKVTERTAKGVVTTNVLMRRAVLVVKAKPKPVVKEESGGGGGGSSGGGGGSGGGSNNQPSTQATNYELTQVCYEMDQSAQISWKPPVNVLRFRKFGESTWHPDISTCRGTGGGADSICSDAYFDNSFPDRRKAFIFISSRYFLSPNTDFEFQIVPYFATPDDNPENSLPTQGGTDGCRSLL